ncbi:c-type cytochrome [Thiohalorhabdus methylotrophus]|uniref:Cytochrome c family protein n=1 Tax=Thiohalorhabdus methylotrophus TaxID=3242694 RepID=A0ABV4TX26_9GAMM
MHERSRRVRKALGAFLLPAAFVLAAASAPDARAQSTAEVAKGQKIFFKVCVQCHTLQEKGQATGPGLAGVLDRVPSERWLMKWLKDPKALVESGDSYARSIADDFPLDMPKLKVMQQKANRRAVLTFLKQIRQDPIQ